MPAAPSCWPKALHPGQHMRLVKLWFIFPKDHHHHRVIQHPSYIYICRFFDSMVLGIVRRAFCGYCMSRDPQSWRQQHHSHDFTRLRCLCGSAARRNAAIYLRSALWRAHAGVAYGVPCPACLCPRLLGMPVCDPSAPSTKTAGFPLARCWPCTVGFTFVHVFHYLWDSSRRRTVFHIFFKFEFFSYLLIKRYTYWSLKMGLILRFYWRKRRGEDLYLLYLTNI